jgi:uncharacterized protein (DUF1330 family)
MAKGYWIVHVDIRDPATYDRYREANAAPLKAYGGRFIVRGGAQTRCEGATRTRTVVVEFPDLEAATECYNSPEYQSAKAIRDRVSSADFLIVEGYEG